ncbi:MAG: hypothetical protein VX278_12500 [Myxococcota bacterium]|nr:hypothetical protein [Myxococcota bacterium]
MSHRYLLCFALFCAGCEIVQDSSGYVYDTATVPVVYHTSLWEGSFQVPSDTDEEGSGIEKYTYVERSEQTDEYECQLDWQLRLEEVASPLCEECLFEVEIFAQLQTTSVNDGTCDSLADATFVYALHENYQDSGMALLYRSVEESEFQPFIQTANHSADFIAELQLEDETFRYRGGYYHYLLP